MVDHRVTPPPGLVRGPALWALSLTSLVLATGAIIVLAWEPRGFLIAAGLGLSAVVARGAFSRVKSVAQVGAQASSSVANLGLVIAGLVITPLLAFAVLWVGLLALIAVQWLLHVLGIS
ncbi:MAG: hypothetical protein WDA27_12300 [Actinomycetota bacterium]